MEPIIEVRSEMSNRNERYGGNDRAAVRASDTTLSLDADQPYDVFLAAPMAGLNTDYSRFRREVMKFKDMMSATCGFTRVYCALDEVASREEFQVGVVAVTSALEALRNSKRFVMLYPSGVVSSVLVEAGFAIAMGIPSVVFTPHLEELPFLLRKAPDAFEFFRCFEANGIEEATERLRKLSICIFPEPTWTEGGTARSGPTPANRDIC